jgi:hypothetical protein
MTLLMALAVAEVLPTDAHAMTLLNGAQADRKNVEDCMLDHGLLLYVGHGDWDRLYADTGGGGEHAILDSGNIANSRGRVIVALACRSGRDLAGRAIDAGCNAYLGLTDDFVWPLDPAGAQMRFAGALTTGLGVMMSGGSLSETRDVLAGNHMRIYEHYWRGQGKIERDSHVYAMFAEHNSYRLVVQGDGSVRPMRPGQLSAIGRLALARIAASARRRLRPT